MRIKLRGFMSHEDSEVTLPSTGVVVVTGPNGSGKSAIAEAIATCLWGKGLRGSRWSPWRHDSGLVEVEVGDLWVARSWDGKTKKLRWSRGGADDHDTNTKSQESLDAVVGSFEAWRRTSVFSSSDAAHFTMASDSERKGLLEELLGLGWFDEALEKCRADLRVANGSLGACQRDRDVAVARATAIGEALAKTQEALGQDDGPTDVGTRRADVARINEHLKDLLKESAEIRSKLDEFTEVGGAHKSRASQARDRLNRLEGSPTCYACGQPVTDELRASMLAEAESAMVSWSREREQVKSKADAARSALEELSAEEVGLRSVRDKVASEISSIVESRKAREKVESLSKSAGEELRKVSSTVASLMRKEEELKVEVAELRACEQILGVRGIRSQVLGTTLGTLEAVTNSWMARLCSDIEVQIRPYTEKKSGGVVDAIGLSLLGAGGVGGYAGASAGERRRVDVAVLLALAELASGSSTSSVRFPVVFDEVFDSLDVDGREQVCELVQSLALDRCVVLITHDEQVAQVRADLRLRVDSGTIS